MKKAYFNIFWAVLAVTIIFSELIMAFNLEVSNQTKLTSLLLVVIWSAIATKNIYSFLYQKQQS